MMLKDSQGRTVLIRSYWDDTRQWVYEFQARDGLKMVPVDEAIVSEGDDIFLNEAQVSDMFIQGGFPGVEFSIDMKHGSGYSPVVVDHGSNWEGGSWSTRSVVVNRIGVRTVDQDTYKRFSDVLKCMHGFNGVATSACHLQKGLALDSQKALEMIGVGKIVTPLSLQKGCARLDERPRLLPGDSVKVKVRGKEVIGVIKSMKSTVTVMRQDGTKGTYAFSQVERTDSAGHNEGLAAQVDPSIRENFEHVVSAGIKRIFRAKLETGDFTFPLFPDTDRYGNPERQNSQTGVMSCSCPVCGWRMADVFNNGEFICCYCRITGNVITRSETEVALLMSRMPAKNRFAIKEARCCGNCGRFQFEVGREGKRSTGYCKTANQCLQGFNVCDMWYPREGSRYESNLRQHITNLHYGVKDGRNTARNDIKDTVYTEEDHKAEIVRADKAKVAYANAYQQFLQNLRAAAAATPLVTEMTPELAEQWQKVLDDPC